MRDEDERATGTSELRAVAEEAGAMLRHGIDAARRWINDRSRHMGERDESGRGRGHGPRWRNEGDDARRPREAGGGYAPRAGWESGDHPGRGRASGEDYSDGHSIGGGAAGGDRERRGRGTGEYGIGQPSPYASRGEQDDGARHARGEWQGRGGWRDHDAAPRRGGGGGAGSWLEDDDWRDRGNDRIPGVAGDHRGGNAESGARGGGDPARRAYGGFSDDIGGRGYRGYDRAGQHDFGADAPAAMRGGFRGYGPRGYTRSDARITEDLNETLSDDDFVDASDIEVQVRDGVASLSGTVGHRWMKHRIEDIAEACSGVRDIDNRIRVHREEDRERTGPRRGGPPGDAPGAASPEKSGATGLGQGGRGGSLEPAGTPGDTGATPRSGGAAGGAKAS